MPVVVVVVPRGNHHRAIWHSGLGSERLPLDMQTPHEQRRRRRRRLTSIVESDLLRDARQALILGRTLARFMLRQPVRSRLVVVVGGGGNADDEADDCPSGKLPVQRCVLVLGWRGAV